MTDRTGSEVRASWISRISAKLPTIAVLILVTALAARDLYQPAYNASDLRVTPDEVEYAVCARRLATLGRYDLDIDGVSTPPYSTPWFSALLAPVYLVAPSELGNGIWVVFAFAVVGVIVTLRIGTLVAGPIGGALASIALLAHIPYPYVSRLIMTDGPAMALGLIACWWFLRGEPDKARVRETLIAGVLVAGTVALRSMYLSLVVPFAWRTFRARERRLAHFAALLTPLLLLFALDSYYNQTTFGDWRRTGYQYWCAVPYDYPELVFSPAYFAGNFEILTSPVGVQALVLGAVGVIAIAVRRPPRWKQLLGFAAVAALPGTVLHLFYFFADMRFHVFWLGLCVILGGIGLASLLPARWREHRWSAIAAVALLVLALLVLQPSPVEAPQRRRAADLIHNATPDDAVIISGLEPIYLEELAPPGSHRTYVATSRAIEFASKVLVKTRVERDLAAPSGPTDHTASGLLAHGGHWAIAHTADEMHEEIDAWVKAGRPVYLERSFLRRVGAVQRMLGTTLRLKQPMAGLTRVMTK